MSTISTVSVRNHTRDLSVKYVLYEYIDYFRNDPEMLELVADNNTTSLLSLFQPTEKNIEFASVTSLRINNILAKLGDSVVIPQNKKNHYKKNPFVVLPDQHETPHEGVPQHVVEHAETNRVHPTLEIYSSVCTAMDIANADKIKNDRASLGLVIPTIGIPSSSVAKKKKVNFRGVKYRSLIHFITTPIKGNKNPNITEYGFAITQGTHKVYDYAGLKNDSIICGTDMVYGDIDINDEFLRKICDDDHFENQTTILQRKLIMLPALRLMAKHKDGSLIHGRDQDFEKLPQTSEEREALAKEIFVQTFLSVTPPVFEKTSGVLEFVRYIEEQLYNTTTTTTTTSTAIATAE
jgi:hypothetical protein